MRSYPNGRLEAARQTLDEHEAMLEGRMGRDLLDGAILALNDDFWGMLDCSPSWDKEAASDAILQLIKLKARLR